MPQLDSPPIDLIIPFGKHKGERLVDVEWSYVNWLATQNPNVTHSGQNWTTIAKVELQSRKGQATELKGMEFEDLAPITAHNSPSGDSFQDFFDAPEKKPFDLPSVLTMSVSQTAIDQASLDVDLLTQFVTRQRVEVGFCSWLKELANVAHSECITNKQLMPRVGVVEAVYSKYKFTFKTWPDGRVQLHQISKA